MELLEQIAYYQAQEDELQFSSFNTHDAWEIGHIIAKRANDEKLAILVDISVSNHTLFRYSAPGTTEYNEHWANRKKNSVMLQQKSSMLFSLHLKRDGKTESISRYLEPAKYATGGGGFPIIIKDTGVIGCIAVSGLESSEDHAVIVDAIREYQNR